MYSQKSKTPLHFKQIFEVKGDLNKDGTLEIVRVYNDTSIGNSEDGYKRILHIYKRENNQLKLIKENATKI